ncbi:MAG: respiratory nitrate reductase subunit gamma [Hyphomicrobiales bacterium]|nr:respiratory nitrate reductase subunit gamma [Hyphomicrobiales bacterium]MDE2016720.1 respiratory nitrate reductase subunit gamma [Hyphomicrobiales bacterium]
MRSGIFAAVFYVASFVLAGGLAYRIRLYAKTPAALRIPTTPAPTTHAGVAVRLAGEVVLFQSLFKANKWTWAFGWVFHAAMLATLVQHLRYFLQPVPWPVVLEQPIGVLAGFPMAAGLFALWGRRFVVERIRYITGPSDHLMLALLVAITVSGLAMKYLAHTDIVALKTFFLGLMRLRVEPLPGDPVLLVHLSLVATLMVVFPFSKLLHAPGVFFSPSRNQPDDTRERRFVSRSALLKPASKA